MEEQVERRVETCRKFVEVGLPQQSRQTKSVPGSRRRGGTGNKTKPKVVRFRIFVEELIKNAYEGIYVKC